MVTRQTWPSHRAPAWAGETDLPHKQIKQRGASARVGREGFSEEVAQCGRHCTLDQGKGSEAALRFPLSSEAGGLGLDQREQRRQKEVGAGGGGRCALRGALCATARAGFQ